MIFDKKWGFGQSNKKAKTLKNAPRATSFWGLGGRRGGCKGGVVVDLVGWKAKSVIYKVNNDSILMGVWF